MLSMACLQKRHNTTRAQDAVRHALPLCPPSLLKHVPLPLEEATLEECIRQYFQVILFYCCWLLLVCTAASVTSELETLCTQKEASKGLALSWSRESFMCCCVQQMNVSPRYAL